MSQLKVCLWTPESLYPPPLYYAPASALDFRAWQSLYGVYLNCVHTRGLFVLLI